MHSYASCSSLESLEGSGCLPGPNLIFALHKYVAGQRASVAGEPDAKVALKEVLIVALLTPTNDILLAPVCNSGGCVQRVDFASSRSSDPLWAREHYRLQMLLEEPKAVAAVASIVR